MNDDTQLLRSYVENRSEDAFTQLVQRHIGLVHSTALRRVGGDAHLANDVVQTVFIALARKAPSLRHHASLAGWLYLSTQLATAAIVRREQRRKHRETVAQTMHLTDSDHDSEAALAQLRPLLDDAIVKLKRDEREAIVLRFFEKRTFAEIGAALLVTEEAARKRVDRALEKLHATFARRGITSTVTALGVALTAAGTSAVPSSLAAQVASAAVTQAATTVTTVTTIASTLVPVAAAIVIGALTIFPQHRANAALAAEIAQLAGENQAISSLRAENYRLSRTIAEASNLEHAAANLPPQRTPLPVPPPPAAPVTSKSIALTTDGRILWEGKYVTLDEYLANLSALQFGAHGGESKLVIRAKDGARFPQVVYTIDEARKAGIRHILVESDATPDPNMFLFWFLF